MKDDLRHEILGTPPRHLDELCKLSNGWVNFDKVISASSKFPRAKSLRVVPIGSEGATKTTEADVDVLGVGRPYSSWMLGSKPESFEIEWRKY